MKPNAGANRTLEHKFYWVSPMCLKWQSLPFSRIKAVQMHLIKQMREACGDSDIAGRGY